MKKFTTIFLFFSIALQSCLQKESGKKGEKKSANSFPFNLQAPSKRYELPKSLQEISGIAAVDDSIIACIADEKGEVYFYNLNSSTIDKKLKFANKGDFEDLTIVKDTLYVLDSKGVIWVIKNYLLQPEVSSVTLNIAPPFELEGLCHRKDTLYIAAKYYHNKKRNETGDLPLWKLTSEWSVSKPLFNLPDYISPGASQLPVPFHTSAIVFNESVQQWYCISTHTKLFIQCSYDGNIINVQPLSGQEFSQPEGICFSTAGDLLISNEGKDGAGTILLFSHLKN
ncbi:hypothetical protein [Ferruginibacter profundus]